MQTYMIIITLIFILIFILIININKQYVNRPNPKDGTWVECWLMIVIIIIVLLRRNLNATFTEWLRSRRVQIIWKMEMIIVDFGELTQCKRDQLS